MNTRTSFLSSIDNNVAELAATFKSVPTVYNVVMTTADTEYSQALPDGCKAFAMSIQGGVAADIFRIAFEADKVAASVAPFIQYAGDVEYFEDGLNTDTLTLYFACDSAAKTMQITVWE